MISTPAHFSVWIFIWSILTSAISAQESSANNPVRSSSTRDRQGAIIGTPPTDQKNNQQNILRQHDRGDMPPTNGEKAGGLTHQTVSPANTQLPAKPPFTLSSQEQTE